MDIISEEDMSMHEVKKVMLEREKERELVYDQKICLDYLKRTATLSPATVKSMTDELSKIVILKPRYITLILNILPDTEEEVESFFSKERTNLKKEEIRQIIDIVKKYQKS